MMSPSDPRIVAGVVALASIAVLVGGAFVGLVVEGAADFRAAIGAFDPYMLRLTRFTLWQAACRPCSP
jgi:thiamine transport system permease protein